MAGICWSASTRIVVVVAANIAPDWGIHVAAVRANQMFASDNVKAVATHAESPRPR